MSVDKEETKLRFRRLFGGILQELFYAVLDERKRLDTILAKSPGKRTKEELQKCPLPASLEAFYVKSIETLNEIGKTYPAKSKEEVILCKELAEYNECKAEINVNEGTNCVEYTVHKPVKQFIDKYYADIIAVRKQHRKEDGDEANCDVIKNLDLSQKKKATLESLQRVFEDGANKYPRLIHLVLEWPLFARMPKPPRSILSFCDQQEYDRMLERQRKDFFSAFGGFSGIETQSTNWFLYPKGESWNKDSGIKRFQDLLIDAYNLLGCDWLKLLYEYIKLRAPWRDHSDGWDGLFDEDYDLDEEGYRRGCYKDYYIDDVFYESVRLCRKLLESESIMKNKNGDSAKEYLEILRYSAEQASIEEIRIIYEVVEFLWIWISKDVPKNKSDFIKAWADLSATTNDRMTKVITWLKWNKSELAKDIEREYSEFINFVEQEISDNPVCKDLTISFTASRGAAINLAKKLKHIAELERTIKIAGQENESMGTQPELTDTEQNIIEALGKNTLTGEELAKEAGYPYNSNFKSTLSSLRKRGILGNKSPGYFVQPKYHFLLIKSD